MGEINFACGSHLSLSLAARRARKRGTEKASPVLVPLPLLALLLLLLPRCQGKPPENSTRTHAHQHCDIAPRSTLSCVHSHIQSLTDRPKLYKPGTHTHTQILLWETRGSRGLHTGLERFFYMVRREIEEKIFNFLFYFCLEKIRMIYPKYATVDRVLFDDPLKAFGTLCYRLDENKSKFVPLPSGTLVTSSIGRIFKSKW